MTIKEAIVEFLNTKDGKKAHLKEIYEGVEVRKPGTDEASVRHALHTYSSDSDTYNKTQEDLFYLEEKGKGVWGLR